ncbi:hypothetical protein [Mesorhizobium shangrilense]|uniref:Amidase domain-containing protein n=1 Tax=Mesorhizobium shangrilense TaxID=460060 RepID=A0ABV2DDR6_9HYPH
MVIEAAALFRWLRFRTMRSEVFTAFQAVFERYDLLVCPTLAAMPVANASDGNTVGPAGLSAQNLPIGLQIIGRRNADADVIAASAAFERIRPWANTYRICHKTVAAAAARSNGANEATNGLVF